MTQRISTHRLFMNIAHEMSKRATCTKRAAVGCTIVLDNHLLATGYNGAPSGFPHCDEVGCTLDSDGHCVAAVHAEENAILQCALHGVSTKGATCYVTHSPCPRCVGRLRQAGIVQVFYDQEFYDLDVSQRFAKEMRVQLSKLRIGH